MSRGKAVFGAVVATVVGVLVIGGCAVMLAYSVGAYGKPGHLTVDHCAVLGASRSQHTDCYGIYRSDDGRTTDPDAVLSHGYGRGSVVSVERADDGTYYPVGLGSTMGSVAGIGFGVMLLGAAGNQFVRLSRRYPPHVPGQRVRNADLPRPLGSWIWVCGFATLGGLMTFVLCLIIAVPNGL